MEQSQSAATAPQVGPVVHRVKEHTGYFEDLVRWPQGRPFELRKNDRGYKRGDVIHLVEWDPDANDGAGAETGRWCKCLIRWTSDDYQRPPLLPADLILLGVDPLQAELTISLAYGARKAAELGAASALRAAAAQVRASHASSCCCEVCEVAS